MNFDSRRLGYSIGVGFILTPLAGFIGAVMFPALLIIWLSALVYSIVGVFTGPAPLTAFNAVLLMLSVPAVAGAYFIWPVTCIVLPLAAALWRPTTAWASLVFCFVGILAGGLAVYMIVEMRLTKIQSDHVSYYLAGMIAGAVCGSLFGRAMWRYDQRRATVTQDATT